MDRLTKIGYVIVNTFYNIDGHICNVTAANNIFSSQKKAQEWIMSTKGKGLSQKLAKYAEANNMSIKFYETGDDGTDYLVDIIDGDKSYCAMQYTIVPVKYLCKDKNRTL